MNRYRSTIIFLIIILLSPAFGFSKISLTNRNCTENLNIGDLLNSYYEIMEALAADNSLLASEKAGEFLILMNNMSTNQMTEEDLFVWIKYTNEMKPDVAKINSTINIEEQRDLVNYFSNNFFEILKVFKIDHVDIYQLYCPMKSVYWLSSSKIIKNPYCGSKMLNCGLVVATLE